ncbi:MAG: AraC family transcriptional regulator [Anaerocolumna sp.]|jgi:AraC-like DNA-binding protein/quercetin dioxygenase-like cupin family protein|nr:AraC family transcriptional regulator [Anaerocolumna sp.]
MPDVNVKITIGNTVFHIISLSTGTIQHIPMHAHGNKSYELHYISTGKGILKTKEKNYVLGPGHMFLTGPNFSHEQIGDEKDPMWENCIYYTILGKSEYEKDDLALTLLGQNFWLGNISPATHTAITKLFREASMGLPDNGYAMYFIAGELLVDLAREFNNITVTSLQETKLNTDDKKFLIIEREFLSNYVTISPQSLSDQLGLSLRQMQRLIKQHYGMTFQQMRLKARLNAASLLLKGSSLSISTIAMQAGFSSLEYFSNCFKKEFHMTAQEFRIH